MSYFPTMSPIGAIQDGITKYNNTNPSSVTKTALAGRMHGFVPEFRGVASASNGEFVATHANLSQPRIKSDFAPAFMGGSPILGEFVDIIAWSCKKLILFFNLF